MVGKAKERLFTLGGKERKVHGKERSGPHYRTGGGVKEYKASKGACSSERQEKRKKVCRKL